MDKRSCAYFSKLNFGAHCSCNVNLKDEESDFGFCRIKKSIIASNLLFKRATDNVIQPHDIWLGWKNVKIMDPNLQMAINNFLYYYFGSLIFICDCVNLLLACLGFVVVFSHFYFILFLQQKRDISNKTNSRAYDYTQDTNTLISFNFILFCFLSRACLPRREHD